MNSQKEIPQAAGKEEEAWDGQARRSLFANIRRVVIKVGSGVLTLSSGLNLNVINGLAREISRFVADGHEVILVSSGAVAAGMRKKGLTSRPTDIPRKQAVAALGQADLIREWEKAFERYGTLVAQVLLTRDDLSNRRRYLNARNTLQMLLSWEVVPILNENDTVVVDELKFGDNDNLSAMITHLLDADCLINLTDIDGLYDSDPRTNAQARLIPIVERITKQTLEMASALPGKLGMGGMMSKISAAKKVTAAGIPMIVTCGLYPETLSRVFAGEQVGTFFAPGTKRLPSKKCWIGYAVRPKGVLVVDEGAAKAMVRGNKSLLPIGIIAVEGNFGVGEPVECKTSQGMVIGVGLVNYDAAQVRRVMGKKTQDIGRNPDQKVFEEVIHRNNLVVTCE